jgi:hypothetical protein
MTCASGNLSASSAGAGRGLAARTDVVGAATTRLGEPTLSCKGVFLYSVLKLVEIRFRLSIAHTRANGPHAAAAPGLSAVLKPPHGQYPAHPCLDV